MMNEYYNIVIKYLLDNYMFMSWKREDSEYIHETEDYVISLRDTNRDGVIFTVTPTLSSTYKSVGEHEDTRVATLYDLINKMTLEAEEDYFWQNVQLSIVSEVDFIKDKV